MNQIQRARLLRVRYLMENLKKKAEDRDKAIGLIASGTDFSIDTVGSVKVEDGVVCPTVCCVIGAAAFDPVFNAQGLTYDLGSPYEDGTTPIFVVLNGDIVGYNSERLARFFGLAEWDYDALVTPQEYDHGEDTTPDEVIDRIDEYLKDADAINLLKGEA